jgi:PhnB protein
LLFGQVVEILRYGDNGMPLRNQAMRGKIMHAKFEGPGVLFYASDNDDTEPMRGSAHILMMQHREQTKLLFERLAQGEGVTTALGIQPWGAYFGKLTDQFGVRWMLNCALQ